MAFRNPLTSLDFADMTGQVGPGQLGPGSVTAGTIAVAVVTATELGAGAVTTTKLAAAAVTAAALAGGAVTGPAIAAGAVTAGSIAAGAIVAGKIAAGAIDGQTITGATIRTAAPGLNVERWELHSVPANSLFGYTGAPVETAPGVLQVNGTGGPVLTTVLAAPCVTGDHFNPPALTLMSWADLTQQIVVNVPITVISEPWVYPVLQNSWVNYNPPTYAAAAYRAMADGTVMIRGFIALGAFNVAIFTLPVGYRPLSVEYFSTVAQSGVAQIAVYATGIVRVTGYFAGGTNANVSLSGIRFSNT